MTESMRTNMCGSKQFLLASSKPRYTNVVDTAWGKYFRDLIKANGRTFDEFEQTPSTLGHYIAGRRKPPVERWQAWADKLKLTGQDRQYFMDLAAIAHLPEDVQPAFVTMLDARKEAEQKIEKIAKYLEERDELIARMERAEARAEHLQTIVHQLGAVIEQSHYAPKVAEGEDTANEETN